MMAGDPAVDGPGRRAAAPPGLQGVEVQGPRGQRAVSADHGHGVDAVEGVAHALEPVQVVGVPERRPR